MKFKIGDRVEVEDCFDGLHLKGRKGTIRCIRSNGWVGVEFDEDFPVGHNLAFEGKMCCTNERGRWGKSDELSLISKHSMKTPSHLVLHNNNFITFFNNELDAVDFIKGLDKSNIKLVEIKTIKTIDIVKSIRSKVYKI